MKLEEATLFCLTRKTECLTLDEIIFLNAHFGMSITDQGDDEIIFFIALSSVFNRF
jgi:hypothetical protein